MWIMLTKKIPVEYSPPKMSIFWSLPWPDDLYAPLQARTCQECGAVVEEDDEEDDGDGKNHKKKRYARHHLEGLCRSPGGPVFPTEESHHVLDQLGNLSPNWFGARRIYYRDHDIRVFPHEFSVVKRENMYAYILSDEPSHFLVTGDAAQERVNQIILEGDLRHIYDAALVDGATHAQAMATAQEMDITIPDAEFPPLGWYRCREEYASIFCEEWEMEG